MSQEPEVVEAVDPRRAPRGRSGATMVREAKHRTGKGAIVVVREWWHRPRGGRPYRYVDARRPDGQLLAEYTANVRGNAAVVFEAFAAGVFDLGMPLAEMPAGLGRAMGRAWLKAEAGRDGRQHIVGARAAGDESETDPDTAVYAGVDDA